MINPVLFAFEERHSYGENIAGHLGLALAPLEERNFGDGEHKTRPLQSVRGCDVYLIQSFNGDGAQSPNDKLCRFLFFAGALKDHGADQVNAIAPYLCYTRKDRRTQPRDPLTMRYVAQLFDAVGVDSLTTLDVHNLQAFQNGFRCRTEHVESYGLFADYFISELAGRDIAVISPDIGGIKRARGFLEIMQERMGTDIPLAFMEKKRSHDIVSGVETLHGDVKNRVCIIFDDMVVSGSTMRRAARAARDKGAGQVYAAAAHGIFTVKSYEVFADPVFNGIVITDTIPPSQRLPEDIKARLVILDSTRLIADTIRRLSGFHSLRA